MKKITISPRTRIIIGCSIIPCGIMSLLLAGTESRHVPQLIDAFIGACNFFIGSLFVVIGLIEIRNQSLKHGEDVLPTPSRDRREAGNGMEG